MSALGQRLIERSCGALNLCGLAVEGSTLADTREGGEATRVLD